MGRVQHPLPLKVIFLNTILIYLHLVNQQRMQQIFQKYYAGPWVDGPPQVKVASSFLIILQPPEVQQSSPDSYIQPPHLCTLCPLTYS